MDNIQIAEKLKLLFEIDNHLEYEEYTPFLIGTPGFSVKRNYPDKISFKPSITKEGKPNNVALIRVVIDLHKSSKSNIKGIPLIFDISMHSIYEYKYYGYDYKNVNCPTKESLEIMNKSPAPVMYTLYDEYYYNENDNILVDAKDTKIKGCDILGKIFNEHCKSTRPSIRLYWHNIAYIAYLLENLITFLKLTLRYSFRTGLSENSSLFPHKEQDMIKLEAKSLNIFGYEASKNVIITFSIIILLLYTLKYIGVSFISNNYLKGIYSNAFLLLCFVLIALPLLEHVGPRILLIFINITIRIRYWCMKKTPLYKLKPKIISVDKKV